MKIVVKIIVVFILCSTIFISVGCRKKPLKDHPEFAGEWKSYGATLKFEGSRGQYSCPSCGDGYDNVHGRASKKGEEIKICNGSCFILKINASPQYDSFGNFITVLNADTFYGIVAPRLLADTVLSSTSVKLCFGLYNYNWVEFNGFTYDIEYKRTLDVSWNVISGSQGSQLYAPWINTLTNLQPSTSYDWRIRTKKGNFISKYVNGGTFTTL